MEIRYYVSNDYEIFSNFWRKHNHTIIKSEMLSPVGIVIEEEGEILAGTWLYIMNGCDVVQIAWTTLNPELKIKQKYECLELLNDAIRQTCTKLKKKNLVVFTTGGLKKFFNKRGLNMFTDHTLLIGEV